MCSSGGLSKGKIAAALVIIVAGGAAVYEFNYAKQAPNKNNTSILQSKPVISSDSKIRVVNTNNEKLHFNSSAKKVIVLDSNTYNLIKSLGKENDVVGATSEMIESKEVPSNLINIGASNDLNINGIIKTNVDIVVGNTKNINSSVIEQLKQKEIKVIDIDGSRESELAILKEIVE